MACPDNHILLLVLAKEATKWAGQNSVECSSSKCFIFNYTQHGKMIGLPIINPHKQEGGNLAPRFLSHSC